MAQLDTREKLAILADAAKYDASCASSGAVRGNSLGGKGVGSTGAEQDAIFRRQMDQFRPVISGMKIDQ